MICPSSVKKRPRLAVNEWPKLPRLKWGAERLRRFESARRTREVWNSNSFFIYLGLVLAPLPTKTGEGAFFFKSLDYEQRR